MAILKHAPSCSKLTIHPVDNILPLFTEDVLAEHNLMQGEMDGSLVYVLDHIEPQPVDTPEITCDNIAEVMISYTRLAEVLGNFELPVYGDVPEDDYQTALRIKLQIRNVQGFITEAANINGVYPSHVIFIDNGLNTTVKLITDAYPSTTKYYNSMRCLIDYSEQHNT